MNSEPVNLRGGMSEADISSLYGYKKDCWSVDQMRVIVIGAGDAMEYTEEDRDFVGLCSALTRELRLRKPLWLQLNARPTFDETRVQFFPEPNDISVQS